ncbi:chemotaxis protein CheX [Aminiphilus circumscriptus]|jgi:chemotaxis protein CheX|uniref:chemotaxis protein CheX n=1 Tax=Aminiphilus circumscriptus TaxID=290732 RepID=UPI000492A25C|nr:chemotaxis protein CheX [Aminiphilus circumscriptus]
MAGELLSKFVNSFGAGLVSVSQTLGVTVSLVKTQVTQGVNAPGSRVAALVGLVGGGVHGTAALMVDEQGFASYVNAMSGGMIPPNLEDNVALSVVGELTNMVSGQTLMKLDIEGMDLTPPQIIAGENIKAVPPQKPGIVSFTLPFQVNPKGNIYLVVSLHS